MNQFENVIKYWSAGMVNEEAIETEISASATYYNLQMSTSGALTVISGYPTGNTINYAGIDDGFIQINTSGFYLFQFVFTVSGSGSAIYKIRCVQNLDTESSNSLAETSEIQFSTRGTGVRWEVANTFLVNASLNDNFSSEESKRQGVQSSINKFQWQVQNTGGEGNFNIVNGLYNIIKIG